MVIVRSMRCNMIGSSWAGADIRSDVLFFQVHELNPSKKRHQDRTRSTVRRFFYVTGFQLLWLRVGRPMLPPLDGGQPRSASHFRAGTIDSWRSIRHQIPQPGDVL